MTATRPTAAREPQMTAVLHTRFPSSDHVCAVRFPLTIEGMVDAFMVVWNWRENDWCSFDEMMLFREQIEEAVAIK